MADVRLHALVERLRATRFSDMSGARAAASVPVPDRLVNAAIAAFLPPSAPVREATVQAQAGNRLRVQVRLARATFLPLAATLEIERQARLPGSPLVLRVVSHPALVGLAGAVLPADRILPPGVRLVGAHVHVDIEMLLERHGYGELLAYLEEVQVRAEPGRLLLDVRLGVQEAAHGS